MIMKEVVDMKKILITGATSGIGLATLNLLKEEYEIYFTYLNSSDIAKSLENENIHGIKLDLNNKESIENLVKKLPNIDILINNAGIAIDNDINLKTYEEFSEVINTNLTGTFYLTKLLLKKINDNGNILFISSTNGIDTPYPESIDYDASKAGIISLMHNFAKIVSPKIRVNTIAPGWVNTRMNETLEEEFIKKEEENILLKRFAEKEEIAKVIKFMISDDASYITDTIIRVDGGLR